MKCAVETYQYGLLSKSTRCVLWQKIFNSKEEALACKKSSLDPDDCQIMRRKVVYWGWEEVGEGD